MTKDSRTLAALAASLCITLLAPVQTLAQDTGGAAGPSINERLSNLAINDELAEIESSIQKLAGEARSADGDGQESARDLHDQLELFFETDLLRRETELGKLERRLRELRQQLEQRRAEKDEILGQQLRELVGEERAKLVPAKELSDNAKATTMYLVHQIKELALLIMIYRTEHSNALPDNLAVLKPKSLKDVLVTDGRHQRDPLAEITDRATLLYFHISEDVLSEIQVALGSFGSVPLLLVPWKDICLVAMADGSVQQLPTDAEALVEKALRVLAKEHGPLQIAIGTEGPVDRALRPLLLIPNQLGIPISTLRSATTPPNSATFHIERLAKANANQNPVVEKGQWYNFYFQEGASPFTPATASNEQARSSLTIHAAKVLDTRDGWAQITFPADITEHMAILAARAKDHKAAGEATINGPAFKDWEESVTEWRSIWVNLDNVTRITEME